MPSRDMQLTPQVKSDRISQSPGKCLEMTVGVADRLLTTSDGTVRKPKQE